MNKRIKIVSIILLALLLISALGTYIMYSNVNKNPLKGTGTLVIDVNEQEGLYTVLSRLQEKDEIKNGLLIKLAIKLNGYNTAIVPGTYEVDKGVSLKELLDTLSKEDFSKNTTIVTIPEGKTIKDIAEILDETGICTEKEFITAVEKYKLPSFVKNGDNVRYKLEGYLYPDTYHFRNNSSPEEIISIMLKKFESVMEELKNEGYDISKKNINKIMTIASLIEKEARVDKDRPLISSVIYNRLDKGMKLQIDATIIYAHGKHLETVLYKDLEIESDYNTYLHTGLPVGPIANPGKESIIAALKPAKTDYLFYLLKPNSEEHYFTNSGEDHENKKQEYGY